MYEEWARRMASEESGEGRRAVVADMCRSLGFSTAKAYRTLKENGWDSGRARRRDSGTTSVDMELLATLQTIQRQCLTKKGKATLPLNVARSILQERGMSAGVGDSRLRSLLREHRMSVADAKTRTPHQRMRTEYPNQVHQSDPSVSSLYYAPRGGQKIIGDEEHYKNKDFYSGGGKTRLKCLRYVLTDHYSGSLCARYYEASGETAANMWDFLLYAWGPKGNNAYVFHGLPELLVWDCGTANLASATVNALRAFGVKTVPHMPGNSRAKGQVENGNRIVERHFESRLRFEPVRTVAELNEAVERWCAAYNANLIKGLDTRLRRGGLVMGRSTLWQRIKPGQIRELPDSETCRQVFTKGIQTRKVGGDLSVSIVHPREGRSLKYSVRDLPDVLVGMEVRLQPLLTSAEPVCIAIIGKGKEETAFELAPIVYDEAGFDVAAPVPGMDYKRPADTAREKAARAAPGLAAVMGPAHGFITADNPFMRQSTGTAIEVAETVHTHEIIVSAVEAAKRVKAELGHVPEGFVDEMRERHPEGVPVRIVNEYIKDRKPKADIVVNTKGWVMEGGASKDAAAEPQAFPAERPAAKIA
ncbi:MAG: transposase [Treponema sp.]|nr:transposase [Treponema sp.]